MSFRIVDTSPQSLYVLNTFLTRIENTLYNFDGRGIKAKSIKASSIDVDTLFVGVGGIKIDSSATISWTKVDNKPNLFGLAVDETGNYTGQIDYDLYIKNKPVIPDLTGYVTQSVLNGQLANYPTTQTINATLLNYATIQAMTTALTGYVTSGTLSNNLNNLLANSNLSTLIGQDYFITGKIAANQIAAGLISGNTIKTSSTTNYSYLHEQYLDIVYGNASKMQFGYQSYGSLGTVPYISFTADGNTSYIAEYNSALELKYGGSTIDLYNDHVIINTPTLNLGAATVATREWVQANVSAPDLTGYATQTWVTNGFSAANHTHNNYVSFSGNVVTFPNGMSVDTATSIFRMKKDNSNYLALTTDKVTFYFTSGSLCEVKPDGFYYNNAKIGTGGGVATFG